MDERNQSLVAHVTKIGFSCEQGSENDVLDRFVKSARKYQADVVVRITGDYLLADSELVGECIRRFRTEHVDYFSNTDPPTYPDGLDIEVVTLAALEQAVCESGKVYDHEHVTPYVREASQFKKADMQNKEDLSALRWTVDEPTNFEVVTNIFTHFAPEIHFAWQQVLELQRSQPNFSPASSDESL